MAELRRKVVIRPYLVELLTNLTEPEQLFHELVQNADDDKDATEISFTFSPSDLTVWNNGKFSRCTNFGDDSRSCNFGDGSPRSNRSCDFHRLQEIQNAEKSKEADTTGAFGIGFNSVFRVSDRPELISSGVHLSFYNGESEQGMRTCEARECIRGCADSPGTKLILPWATEKDSEGRKFYEQPAITPADSARYEEATVASVPMALLFNTNLKKISVESRDGTIHQWIKTVDGQTVTIGSSDSRQRWRKFDSDLSENSRFRTTHREALDDDEDAKYLCIAVREDAEETTSAMGHQVGGRLFVTFPTEVETHLPVHVNAKFQPERSRRRLKLDGDLGRWNKDVVAQAGRAIAAEIVAIRDALGSPMLFWELVYSAWTAKGRGPDDLGITNYWEDCLKEALRAQEVIWVESGKWCSADGVRSRYLEQDDEATEDEDQRAIDVLKRLGVETVHRRIQQKSDIQIFKELGIKELGLSDVATALEASEFLEGTEQFVGGKPSLLALWRECNRLIPSGQKGAAIRSLRLWPTAAGSYLPATDMRRADDDPEIQRLVKVFDLAVDFLGDDIPSDLKQLREVVEGFELGDLVDALEASEVRNGGKLVEVGNEDRNGLFRWILDCKKEIEGDPSLKDRLRSLPLYPTKNEPCSLKDARLPTGFKDPLGIARTIDTTALEGVEELLELLDAAPLDFETYCTEFLPKFFEDNRVEFDQRRDLVRELTTHLRSINDEELIREALRPLQVVECAGSETQFLAGGQVYFPSNDVERVLGSGVPVAVELESTDTRKLFELLGVTGEPRLPDVVEAVKELSRKAMVKTTISQAGHTIDFLGSAWPKSRDDDRDYDWEDERESFKKMLAPLKELSWLPRKGGNKWHTPDQLAARIKENLFADQAIFLDLSKERQKDAKSFLEWLGVRVEPKPEQVVAQLSHCAELGKRVDPAVYEYLDKKAESWDSENPLDHLKLRNLFEPLEGKPCLLVDPEREAGAGTDAGCKYLPAHQVYRSEPNLGGYRYQLDDYYLKFESLLAALGVKDSPDAEDVGRLLPEITAAHVDAPMGDKDKGVIKACWVILEDQLRKAKDSEREGSPDALVRLRELLVGIGRKATFFNKGSIAKRPNQLVLNDWNARAAYLAGNSRTPLIDENEFMNALSEAGAKKLSTDLQFTIIEDDLLEDDVVKKDEAEGGTKPGVVAARLEERWELLERVFAWDEADDRDALSRLRDLRGRIEVRRSTRLRASLWIHNILSQGDVEINAFFDGKNKELFYMSGDSTPWTDIATELLAALTRPPKRMLIPHIEEALGAESVQDADRKLNDWNVPRLLDERVEYPSPVATVDRPVDAEGALVEPDPDTDGDAVIDAESSAVSGFEPDSNSYGDSRFEGEAEIDLPADLDSGEYKAEDLSQGSPDEDSGYQDDVGEVSGEHHRQRRRQSRWEPTRRGPKDFPTDRPSDERGASRSSPPQRYTIDIDQSQTAGPSDELRKEIGREGEREVLKHEKGASRYPVNMNDPNEDGSNRGHDGYDIESKSSPDGEVERYIEVKATTGAWVPGKIALSVTQLEAAQDLGDKYWLYVIEYLGTDDQKIYPIKNPYGLLDGFYFGPRFKDEAES